MAIQEAIEALKEEIQQRYPVLLDYLLPGVDSVLLKQKFDRFGLHPSEEVYEFYKWTLWVNLELMYQKYPRLEYTLFSGFYPSPLDLENIEKNVLFIHGNSYWDFMRNDFGDFFIVPMHLEPSERDMVYLAPEGLDYNRVDEVGHVKNAFLNLEIMFNTVIALFKSGDMYYSIEGNADILEQTEESLVKGRELNLGMEYWRE